MKKSSEELEVLFQTLGDRTRLRLLNLMAGGEVCVCFFVEVLDEPQPTAETHGYATSGWNAAPTAAKIIARVAPMLGLEPRLDLPPADQLILANMKQAAR